MLLPKRPNARDRMAPHDRRAGHLTALEREFLPPLLEIAETPPSPLKRSVLWTVVWLSLSLIVWASVSRVSIVATATGKFIPDGRVKEVQPLQSSIVKAIHVREGQRVRKGDLLIELDPALSDAELTANSDKYSLNQLEQERLRGELASRPPTYAHAARFSRQLVELQDGLRRARERAYKAKLAQAQSALDEKIAARAAATETLHKFEETSQIASERESSARPLVDNGAISRTDYLQLRQQWVESRDDLAAQVKTVQEAAAAVAEAEQAIQEVRRSHEASIYDELDQKVSNEPGLKGDLDKSRQLHELNWLRSPVGGLVQSVAVTTLGQVVTPAQSLVTIVPDDLPLIVEATLTNEDIGYVSVGQPVDVKVDTFPFQKYGSLKGTLVWVSPDAEERTSTSRDLATRTGAAAAPARSDNSPPLTGGSNGAGYVYKVHVRTADSRFRIRGQSRPVLPGMTVQADITTDRRKLIDFFLSPVTKYLDEGLTVR